MTLLQCKKSIQRTFQTCWQYCTLIMNLTATLAAIYQEYYVRRMLLWVILVGKIHFITVMVSYRMRGGGNPEVPPPPPPPGPTKQGCFCSKVGQERLLQQPFKYHLISQGLMVNLPLYIISKPRPHYPMAHQQF